MRASVVTLPCDWIRAGFRSPVCKGLHSDDQPHAGGGIVFDSVEEDEYVETINKLGANVKCIDEAESECRLFFVWVLRYWFIHSDGTCADDVISRILRQTARSGCLMDQSRGRSLYRERRVVKIDGASTLVWLPCDKMHCRSHSIFDPSLTIYRLCASSLHDENSSPRIFGPVMRRI